MAQPGAIHTALALHHAALHVIHQLLCGGRPAGDAGILRVQVP
jgi:hypothetical protein